MPEPHGLTPEGDQISDPYDCAETPCYDQQAVMRRYDVIAEVCDYMLKSVAEKHGLRATFMPKPFKGLPRPYLGLVAGWHEDRLRR